MRAAAILIALLVAASLGLGVGELLANSQTPVVITSMSSRPDLAQLQAAAWDWLSATVTAREFIYGAVAGVVLAECGRYLLFLLARTFSFVAALVALLIHYRLAAAAAAIALYYAAAYSGLRLGTITQLLG